MEDDIANVGTMEKGHDSHNSLVIDNEGNLSVTQEMSSVAKTRLIMSKEVPPRYRKIKTAEDEAMDIDFIEIDLTDSENSGEEETISSQTMVQEFPGGLDATRCSNLLVIKDLPSYIHDEDLVKLLNHSGFASSVRPT
jgi:hypothetical protein